MRLTIADIFRARGFARAAHAGQYWGDLPFPYHLSAVERVLTEHGFTDPFWMIWANLHDVLEDTDATFGEIAQLFGDETSRMVWACTGVGKNRKARQADIKAKIHREGHKAAILKAADRIANMERAIMDRSQFGKMYVAESPVFNVFVGHYLPAPMLARLRDSCRTIDRLWAA